jgi:hypothetical protein
MAAVEKPPPPPGKALRGYDEDFLECRYGNLGHVWHVVGFYRGDAGEVRRVLRCDRCETERVDRWLRSGERVRSAYTYAEGYKLVTDGRLATVDVRLEVLRRATVYANENQMLQAVTQGRRK